MNDGPHCGISWPGPRVNGSRLGKDRNRFWHSRWWHWP